MTARDPGAAGAGVSDALTDPRVKELFKTRNNAALAKGLFGSPFAPVGDQPFWFVERPYQVNKWLETGGG